MSDDQLHDLHQELCDLYRMYCDPTAIDRIQFDSDIVSALKDSKLYDEEELFSLVYCSNNVFVPDDTNPGLILGWCPANGRRRFFVTTSLIGWVQA